MAPLSLEVYVADNHWKEIAQLGPKNRPGSISNTLNESREIYMFECLNDNSKSLIYKAKKDINLELNLIRIIDSENLEIIKELKKGDEPYKINIKTDRDSQSRIIRFTHI
jgi:hypothetical protein